MGGLGFFKVLMSVIGIDFSERCGEGSHEGNGNGSGNKAGGGGSLGIGLGVLGKQRERLNICYSMPFKNPMLHLFALRP